MSGSRRSDSSSTSPMSADSELTLFADVLVIGGGPAAAWAAWSAATRGAKVVVVDKGFLGASGPAAASGNGVLTVPPEEREQVIAARSEVGQGLVDPEPAYLAKNPNGLIPVLEDAGEALWESNAILRYVFARYGKAPLHPDDPIGRARADAWTEWYGSTFWPNVRVQLVQLVRTPEGKRDAAVIEAAQAQTKGALAILEAHLAKQPFVTGREFTWGDIPLAAAAQRWFNLPIKRPSHPAVEAWYARIRERPAFKKWIDIPLT